MSYNAIFNKVGLNTELVRLKNQAGINWSKELRVLKQFGLKDGMSILEMGSGPGFYTKFILEAFPNSKITCLELNDDFIKYATNYLSDYSERIHFVKDNIEYTKLRSNTFDAVISRLVLEHLSSPEKAVHEMYRILKPRGLNIILDIDNEAWGMTFPYNEFIYSSNKSMENFQSQTGGDRKIGRKLLYLLKTNRFVNLDYEVIATHSDIVGLTNILGVQNINDAIKALNIPGTPTNSYEYKLKSDYAKFISSPNSSVILLMIAACGRKL